MRPTQTAIAVFVAAAMPLSALAAPLTVPIDQVRKLPYAGMAASVSPGNPTIADVNVIDQQTILVVGKHAGVTNLIVLDRAGRTLFNDRIIVSSGGGAGGETVIISRGGKTTTYACAPYCQTMDQGPSEPSAAAAPK